MRHIGEIYEGRWKVVSGVYKKSTDHTYYTLENTMNGMQIQLSDSVLRRIILGQTSVSAVMHYRIEKDKLVKAWNRSAADDAGH